MSRRELKFLLAASNQLSPPKTSQRRILRGEASTHLSGEMDSVQQQVQGEESSSGEPQVDLRARVSELQVLVDFMREEASRKDEMLDRAENKLLHVKAEAEAELQCLREELKEVKLVAELDRLRALENMRQENLVVLKREQSLAYLERERFEEKFQALTAAFEIEKKEFEQRVKELNEQIRKLTRSHVFEREASDTEISSDEEEAHDVSGRSSPTDVSGHTSSIDATAEMKESATETKESAGLLATMAKLLKAQTDAIEAQTQVAASQHLPPLRSFTGEGIQTEEKTFERWLELFEERAQLACWGPAQRLHHLKFLLERTALKAFRSLEVQDREDYDRAIAALRKRFKSVEIEELRGFEFHRKMQGKESIEELGMDLLALGRKAFPSSHGKEFDRLLKGRFYQAIHVKWQRKLGAPKTGESFQELFDRARVLEQHEKQYLESAASREDFSSSKNDRQSRQKTDQHKSEEESKRGSVSSRFVPIRDRICYTCKQSGHMSHNCPLLGNLKKKEAPGKSSKGLATLKSSCNVALESKESCPSECRGCTLESKESCDSESKECTEVIVKPSDLSTQQLKELLAQRQLQDEQVMMESGASVVSTNAVSAKERNDLKAVGPTVHLSVKIGGVPVEAMVDTGSQSTIISRSLLHEIGRHLKSKGESLPVLEKPTARLFGKDGEGGGRELSITAQLYVDVEADGESVSVPVFVQPQSEQQCLLGMNVLPALGLAITRANGMPLIVKNQVSDHSISSVRLVQTESIPSLKGRFLEVEVNQDKSNFHVHSGSCVLFEPQAGLFEPLGLHSHESLLTVQENGCVLVSVQNPGGATVRLDKGLNIGVVSCVLECCDVLNYNESVEGVNCKYNEGVEENSVSRSKSENEESDGSEVTGMFVCGCVKTIEQTPERTAKLFEYLELPQEKLTEEQYQQLRDLLEEYSDVFALSDSELGCTDLVKHCIDVGDNRPIKQQPYRTPAIHRDKISQMVSEMKEQGIVKPSISPWASPVVLVPKKDGKLRFCVDYRRLNAITKKDVYPLPRIDDILDKLGKAKYFSTLDLCSGYWQVELDENSRQKTAFTTHNGLFEFVRMPFGLCNAPATFQRLMQAVLAGLEWDICFDYIDDILIASRTFEDHLRHLRQVFDRLRQAGLRLKPKKCSLLREEVLYLGHVVSYEGVRPDPEKVEKMKHYPVPTDVSKVRQFLGLASYYRKFIQNFSKIAHPLHELTKKNVQFHWSAECESAFSHLKECLVTAPVLSYPCFGPGQEFVLETDASGVGLGAVLAQEQDGQIHPIAYASRTLDSHEKNYGISELETLGLVWAVKYFRSYILGHRTTVYTDHAACTSLLNSTHLTGKLARWALTIQEMDLVIKHKAGRKNTNADALSRNTSADVNAIDAVEQSPDQAEYVVPLDHDKVQEIRVAQRSDTTLTSMFEYLERGVLPSDEKFAKRLVMESSRYEVIQGVLYYEPDFKPGNLCVVVPENLRPTLLKEAHAGCFAGHFAFKKVYDRLRRNYWWKGMRGDVDRFCRSCLECASRKGPGRSFRPPLTPIPVGGPFHRLGVDVLQLPLTANGNRYVVCFVDYFTKWVEAFPVADQRADTIAKLFVEHVVCRHGVPEELLSDRGANFLSDLIQSVCDILGVKKINTSGYHPQTDGLVEKFNSTLINMIAKCCEISHHDWDEQLPFLLFAYRSSVQESTKESPFFLLHGRDPRLPTETVLSKPVSPYLVDVEDYRMELSTKLSYAWSTAKDMIGKAQQKQKFQYDKKAKEPKLTLGSRVMVYMPSEVQGQAWKLARPFHGPYRVVALTANNAEVVLIDKPKDQSIFVSLDRIRLCYDEMEDATWTGPKKKRKYPKRKEKSTVSSKPLSPPRQGPTTRSMTRASV